MLIRVLGSSGSEVPGHNPPAFLIDDFLLLDAGTVSLSLDHDAQCKITHIFLTHAHLDHIKAIPFLLDNMVLSDQGCRLTILSGKEVIEDLKTNIFNGRIWPDFTALPDAQHPVMRFQEVFPGKPVAVRGYRVYAATVDHTVPAYGYLIENSTNTAVIYTGDTGPTEGLWRFMSKHRVEALIIEVSFPDEMLELAMTSGHLTPSLLAAEIGKMPVLPKRIYITHLKPFYKVAIKKQLGKLNHPNIEVLEDGMVLSIK
jgi:ribonuclease BN (tRNA processing enzyme)